MKFSPAEIMSFTVALCGLALTVLNIIDKGIIWHKSAEEPQEKMRDKIDRIEERVEKLEIARSEDQAKFDGAAFGGEVMMKAVLALLSHSIDGNNVDGLKDAKKEVNNYLVQMKTVRHG